MNPDIKWKVQYEDSLIQPGSALVIDINIREYASGTRQLLIDEEFDRYGTINVF